MKKNSTISLKVEVLILIVLLKVGNLHQNAKRYEARNTERVERNSYTSEREARRPIGRAPQARSFLRAARVARDENVRAKRADFLVYCSGKVV